ncbi:hypothetical protein ACOSP7_019228 [Xanthoceras sorbifolium]
MVRTSAGFCDPDGDDIKLQLLSDEGDETIAVAKYCHENQWTPKPNGSIDFKEGQIFGNAKLVRKVVKQYAIQEGFMLTKIKNDRTRYTIKCKNETSLERTWPRVGSQYYFRHIIANFRATLKNLNMTGKLWVASRVGDAAGFKEVMESINDDNVYWYYSKEAMKLTHSDNINPEDQKKKKKKGEERLIRDLLQQNLFLPSVTTVVD